MILEKFVLNSNANFKYKNSGDNVIFSKGVTFGTKVDSDGNILYIDEDGIEYISNDSRLPTKVTNEYITTKPTLFYIINPITKSIIETKLIIEGASFIRDKDGFYDYHGKKHRCVNEENLEQVLEYPSVQVKAEVENDTIEKKKVFELNPNAKYCGDDGIDAAILFLQTTDLSKHIVRDDKSHTLFVDLGPAEMWTDIDNSDWIMKLNARIPLASAVSIGKRLLNGKQRLAVVLNSNFV